MVQRFTCSECDWQESGDALVTVCPHCQRPLLAEYDLTPLGELGPTSFQDRRRDLWRYEEVLPVGELDRDAGQLEQLLGERGEQGVAVTKEVAEDLGK